MFYTNYGKEHYGTISIPITEEEKIMVHLSLYQLRENITEHFLYKLGTGKNITDTFLYLLRKRKLETKNSKKIPYIETGQRSP